MMLCTRCGAPGQAPQAEREQVEAREVDVYKGCHKAVDGIVLLAFRAWAQVLNHLQLELREPRSEEDWC